MNKSVEREVRRGMAEHHRDLIRGESFDPDHDDDLGWRKWRWILLAIVLGIFILLYIIGGSDGNAR